MPIAFGLLVLGEDAGAERLAGIAAIGLGSLLLGRRTEVRDGSRPARAGAG